MATKKKPAARKPASKPVWSETESVAVTAGPTLANTGVVAVDEAKTADVVDPGSTLGVRRTDQPVHDPGSTLDS